MSPNLGVGFELRCFQLLSRPDLATQQCSWRNSWYTRGQFLRVLSSNDPRISAGLDYIFIRP